MKKQLVIEESQAIKLYKIATPELKVILEESFGKDNLTYSYTRIRYIFDAYNACNLNYWENTANINSLPFPNDIKRNLLIHTHLCIITKALNDHWSDTDPNYWYEMYLNPFGVLSIDTHTLNSMSIGSGVSLQYKSKELAEYSMKQFKALWIEYFTGK